MNRETYREMKQRHQQEVNALPLAFAFSREQFETMLSKWGISQDEAKDGAVVGMGNGCFIRAADRDTVVTAFKRIAKEEADAVASDRDGNGYIYEMFLEELLNHEYTYTGDLSETLDAVGMTLEQVQKNEPLKNGLRLALERLRESTDGVI